MAKFLLVNIPTVWLGVGLVVISVGLWLVGLLIVRKIVAQETLEAQHEVAGFLIAVVGVIYAVLFAFVVIIVWEQYVAAESAVGDEAAAVGSLYRDGVALGAQGRQLRAAVNKYAVSVVDVEWPYMATHLTEASRTDAPLNEVWSAVTNLRATNADQRDFAEHASVTSRRRPRTGVRECETAAARYLPRCGSS